MPRTPRTTNPGYAVGPTPRAPRAPAAPSHASTGRTRRALRRSLLRSFGAVNALAYRLSGGRLMNRFPSGAPVFLLTTTGRKSGRRRTVPLLYLADGDDLIIVGSQGGAPTHPAWYLNLRTSPDAEAEIGTRRFAVRARTVEGTERHALWPRLVALYPPYAAYQRRTSRQIPIIRLTPR